MAADIPSDREDERPEYGVAKEISPSPRTNAMTENRTKQGLAILTEAIEKVSALLGYDLMHCVDDRKTELRSKQSQAEVSNRVENRVAVYIAGCRGCRVLAQTWGPQIKKALGLKQDVYIAKIGTTSGSLETRLRQIGKDRFGATIRERGRLVVEDGFSAWIGHSISPSRAPTHPAVTVEARTISVALPAGVTRRKFDAELNRMLASRALANARAVGMPERLVAYSIGGTRISSATEFYALSPHVTDDVDLLLSAVETIVREGEQAGS